MPGLIGVGVGEKGLRARPPPNDCGGVRKSGGKARRTAGPVGHLLSPSTSSTRVRRLGSVRRGHTEPGWGELRAASTTPAARLDLARSCIGWTRPCCCRNTFFRAPLQGFRAKRQHAMHACSDARHTQTQATSTRAAALSRVDLFAPRERFGATRTTHAWIHAICLPSCRREPRPIGVCLSDSLSLSLSAVRLRVHTGGAGGFLLPCSLAGCAASGSAPPTGRPDEESKGPNGTAAAQAQRIAFRDAAQQAGERWVGSTVAELVSVHAYMRQQDPIFS